MNTNLEDVTQLLDLPEHVRTHPLFRQGYNIGASHRAHGQHLPESDQGTRTVRAGGSPAPAPFYGIAASGLRDRLGKGVRIVRELSAESEHDVTTETPCCGRRITIPASEDDGDSPAFCCKCGILYAAVVAVEELDGYSDEPPKVALFVVEHVNVAVAQHRVGKWERRSHGTAGASA